MCPAVCSWRGEMSLILSWRCTAVKQADVAWPQMPKM